MEQTQLLRESNSKPTPRVIANALGGASNAYIKFIDDLKKDHGITLMDWRYYNDGKAWLSKCEYKWTNTRGTNKVKPDFWLSIWDGFFKVSFYFGANLRDDLLKLQIFNDAKKIITNATINGIPQQFISGMFEVKNDKQLHDVY